MNKETIVSETVTVSTFANPFLSLLPSDNQDVNVTSVTFGVTADCIITCHQFVKSGIPGGGSAANVNSAGGKLKTAAPVSALKSHNSAGTKTILWQERYKAAEGSRTRTGLMTLNGSGVADADRRGLCFTTDANCDVSYVVTCDIDHGA